MRLFIGNTDSDWFFYLRNINPEDVNFWQPGGNTSFKILEPGAPFLFRLKRHYNAIAGLGFFSSHTRIPLSIAWEMFNDHNGCKDFLDFKTRILRYRSDKDNPDPYIGCIVLTNPIFFDESEWIKVPEDWNKSIVQGKSYDMDDLIGKKVWQQVEERIHSRLMITEEEKDKNQLILEEPSSPEYRLSVLQRVRLGQGAFRVLIMDAYNRRCAISGERTLPVLEAAHIKPYAQSGPHFIKNGLLLRSDMHKLFDTGYITVTKDYKVEISKRIRQEFENGRIYYQFHGSDLLNLPSRIQDLPDSKYLTWHNENIYRG